jgi:hypothetical protein
MFILCFGKRNVVTVPSPLNNFTFHRVGVKVSCRSRKSKLFTDSEIDINCTHFASWLCRVDAEGRMKLFMTGQFPVISLVNSIHQSLMRNTSCSEVYICGQLARAICRNSHLESDTFRWPSNTQHVRFSRVSFPRILHRYCNYSKNVVAKTPLSVKLLLAHTLRHLSRSVQER